MYWIMNHWYIGLFLIPFGVLLAVIGTAFVNDCIDNKYNFLTAIGTIGGIIGGIVCFIGGQVWLLLSLIAWIVQQVQ